MSELISGKEALIALVNGEEVECENTISGTAWANARCLPVESFLSPNTIWSFRLKPRTITINGIEVPAPFEPKDGQVYYHLSANADAGYERSTTIKWSKYLQFGAWKSEEEVTQVVKALRQVFGKEMKDDR